MTLDPERRQAILDAVGHWLDEHPDEPLPAGIDPDLADAAGPPADLATLAGSVIGLRHDVKLQTKVLKRFEDRLEESSRDLQRATQAAAARADGAGDALVELFDRLRRCLQACREAGADLPWLARRGHTRRLIDGLGAGVELTLERAAELLGGLGLQVDEPTGKRFDPRTMRAVGQAPASNSVPAGHVIETVRVGILRHPGSDPDPTATPLRPADVIVARDQESV